MDCPKCGQRTLNIDEERDLLCYMCGYSSARREPTKAEIVHTNHDKLSGNALSYGSESLQHTRGFEYQISRKAMGLPERRRKFTTGKVIKNVNKAFNTAIT